jgi:hypothetical protein
LGDNMPLKAYRLSELIFLFISMWHDVTNYNIIFLSDRTQVVIVESEQSSYLPVNSGVPLGSLLGPILFLYYINNIPTELDPGM